MVKSGQGEDSGQRRGAGDQVSARGGPSQSARTASDQDSPPGPRGRPAPAAPERGKPDGDGRRGEGRAAKDVRGGAKRALRIRARPRHDCPV